MLALKKIKKMIEQLRTIKRKSAQAMVEFAAVLPLLIMILLGTYDIFNLSFSYLQMTFLGHTYLSANLMNQQLGYYDMGNYQTAPSNARALAVNLDNKGHDSTHFPLFFFFGQNKEHRKTNHAFCIHHVEGPNSSDSTRRTTDAVGQIYCLEIWHNVDLITGKLMFGKSQKTLKKKVCAIQEKTFDNKYPNWESISCPSDMSYN